MEAIQGGTEEVAVGVPTAVVLPGVKSAAPMTGIVARKSLARRSLARRSLARRSLAKRSGLPRYAVRMNPEQ